MGSFTKSYYWVWSALADYWICCIRFCTI